jgi:hypothetical protein
MKLYELVDSGWLKRWLQRPLFPSTRRKVVCVVQLAGLILALLPWIEPPLSASIAAVSLAALTYSFVVDCLWLWRRREAA